MPRSLVEAHRDKHEEQNRPSGEAPQYHGSKTLGMAKGHEPTVSTCRILYRSRFPRTVPANLIWATNAKLLPNDNPTHMIKDVTSKNIRNCLDLTLTVNSIIISYENENLRWGFNIQSRNTVQLTRTCNSISRSYNMNLPTRVQETHGLTGNDRKEIWNKAHSTVGYSCFREQIINPSRYWYVWSQAPCVQVSMYK